MSEDGIRLQKEGESIKRRQSFTKRNSTIMVKGQKDSEAGEVDKVGEGTP